MNTVQVYKCLCDEFRLRILNLLNEGPLCVCHLVEILDEEQVRISKQLRYMRDNGMVKGERSAQWMVYSLSDKENPLLRENLKCLQDLYANELHFVKDMKKREGIMHRLEAEGTACMLSANCC